MKRALAGLAIVAAAGGAASAQSRRYPPPVVDLDDERDTYSRFWEDAIEPGRDQYDDLIRRAQAMIPHQRGDAETLLVQATQLLPDQPDAWAWLGFARAGEGDFVACKDALERAWAIDPSWEGGKRPLGLALASCRARAGDLEGAAEILERLVARGTDDVETLWRLGEVDMAQGRLDDARSALALALDQSPADPAYVHAAWAYAVATDRARDPDAASAAAQAALGLDPERLRVGDPPEGFLPPSDAPYYSAIAAEAAGVPELALLGFRRFRALVPDGPWARRAAEHERSLDDFAIADRVTVGGTEPGDVATIRARFARAESALRACLAETPRLVLEVNVTVVAPDKTPAIGHPARLPVAGVTVGYSDGDATSDELAAATACVRKVAGGIVLPKPTVAGTWTMATAPIIAR